jgi:hypothetical protein
MPITHCVQACCRGEHLVLRFPKEVKLPTRVEIHPHLYKRTNYISKPKSPTRKKLKKIREARKLKKEKLKQFKEKSLKSSIL